MTRVRDWETRFVVAMNAERKLPFGFGDGKGECATLMGAAVRASAPDHPALRLLKRYSTEIGAARVLRREGGLEVILDRYFDAVPVSMAQTGDIGLLISPDGVAAGLVIEGSRAIGRSLDAGFYFIPVASVSKAYRVD